MKDICLYMYESQYMSQTLSRTYYFSNLEWKKGLKLFESLSMSSK